MKALHFNSAAKRCALSMFGPEFFTRKAMHYPTKVLHVFATMFHALLICLPDLFAKDLLHQE